MNYDELVDASKAYADRYDIAVDQNMDTFILLTEARMNRLLKTRKQSSRGGVATTTDVDQYPLPTDWAGFRDLSGVNINQDTGDVSLFNLSFLEPKAFKSRSSMPAPDVSQQGGYYSIQVNSVLIFPTMETGNALEWIYYQKVPHLKAFDPIGVNQYENWMSIDQPDIYIAGMCAEISLFAKDYDAADGWFARLKVAIGELDNVDWVERWSGDPLQIRLG